MRTKPALAKTIAIFEQNLKLFVMIKDDVGSFVESSRQKYHTQKSTLRLILTLTLTMWIRVRLDLKRCGGFLQNIHDVFF